jgi:nitroimidazol reductase NimA-like FMN-containing flavoprotein (pyridoxamine 5'-phosphate oxidase superfamily)
VTADAAPTAIPQGSLQLLDTPVARRLLAWAIHARVAYTAKDGTPRIVPTWFQWTNGELVMPTYIQAPHIPAPGARRLAALRARPAVAVSIDTDSEPPQGCSFAARRRSTRSTASIPTTPPPHGST